MSLPIIDRSARVQYTATAGQTSFVVPFEFFENSNLVVYRGTTQLTLSTSPTTADQYSVTGAGAAGGGTVTLGAGATLGDVLTIVRDVPVERITDFPSSGPFQIDALNAELARLTAMIQQQETKIDKRTLILADFDGPNAIDPLPAAAPRANRFLAFDANGNPVAAVSTDGTGGALSAALAAPTGGALVGILGGGTVQDALDNAMSRVSSYAALAALTGMANGNLVVLTEAGRTGIFVYSTANLTANVASDPNQGVYIAPTSDPTGASGAWVRQINGPLNVKWFGADPARTAAENVAAFQAALDDGRPIYIPSGTYRLNAKLISTGKAVDIYTGGGVTLKWVTGSTTQGLDFTFSNLTTQTCTIGDIVLLTEVEGGGSAIKLTWPVGASGFNRLYQLGKIRISGSDITGQVGYWDYGIDTTNGWLGFTDALDFYGKVSGTTPLSTAAWVARGTSTDSRCHIRARYAKAMLLIAGFSEGLDISGSFAVACDYGVDCSGTSGLNTPGLVWIGGHAACYKGAVRAVNILQGNVADLLVYKRDDSPHNFIAFDLDSASTDWHISNSKVFSLSNPGGGTTTAIKDAGTNNISSGIRCIGCDTDVNIVSGASGFSHEFSRSDNSRGAITQGDTDGQVTVRAGGSLGSSVNYFDTLTANSATPSILGYRQWSTGGGHFLTANTSPTTITNFTGAFPGDEIVVQANDANTTIQHNAGLLLNGAANKVMANGDTVRLRRINSTTWKQIG